MLSYIPTYKDEPSAHGRCELEARRSVHPERMQVGALTSIWQVGVPPAEAQGVDSANSLFYKKVRSNISHGFTYSILLSTTSQQRPGFQQYGNQRFHNSMDLQPMTTSYCRHSPSLQRGKYVISFYFPLFKQSGINYPPTSSVPLSFKKGAAFSLLEKLQHSQLL